MRDRYPKYQKTVEKKRERQVDEKWTARDLIVNIEGPSREKGLVKKRTG